MLDRKGRLSMDEPKKRLLNSLRTEPGVFSEVYISSPVGEGVARNILDPATHLLFSNKLEDNAPIDELRAQGGQLASLPILAFTAPTLGGQDWGAIDATGWAAMAWVIVGPVFVAWSVWNWVLRHLTPRQVAPLLFTVPVTSGFAAWILLDETIVAGQIAGAALVVVGLIANQRATARA